MTGMSEQGLKYREIEETSCEVCGAPFNRYSGMLRPRVTCSKKCADERRAHHARYAKRGKPIATFRVCEAWTQDFEGGVERYEKDFDVAVYRAEGDAPLTADEAAALRGIEKYLHEHYYRHACIERLELTVRPGRAVGRAAKDRCKESLEGDFEFGWPA